jgi:hypothetical protein
MAASKRHVSLCGPEPFAAEVKKALRDLGFDLAKLHNESFGRGRVACGVKGGAKSLILSEPRHKICFSKTGVTVDTDETVTLLELAEAHTGSRSIAPARLATAANAKSNSLARSVRKGSSSSLEKSKRTGLLMPATAPPSPTSKSKPRAVLDSSN